MSIISTGAGHGGLKTNGNWRDSGAVGNGYQEADVARTINAKIIAKTKVPDTTDNAGTSQNDNLAKITAKINVCGDGWALSNHLNSFNGSATGVEVLYGSPSSKPMAEAMSKAIADALGLPNRGAKDGSWLYIAKHSNSGKKVLLIEWGFIDNPNDMNALMANMDKAIDAMLGCFGYSPSSQPSTPVPTPSKPNPGKTVAQIAQEVIDGKWGNDPKRSADLKKAGYDAEKVRAEVNRQLGATSKPKPKPAPAPKPQPIGWKSEKGHFKLNTAIKLRTGANTSSGVIATLSAGSVVNYDAFIHQGGYVWIRQPRANGYGYLATGVSKNGKRQNYWGTFY